MPFLSRVAKRSLFSLSISSVYSYTCTQAHAHTHRCTNVTIDVYKLLHNTCTDLYERLLCKALVDLWSVGDVFGSVGIV